MLSFARSCGRRSRAFNSGTRALRGLFGVLPVPLLFLFGACEETTPEQAGERAAPIIQSLVNESSSLPMDARLAVGSYMDAQRIRIEMEKARLPGRLAALRQRLDSAEVKLARRSTKYHDSLRGIWDAIREAEDPNLDGKERQELSPYLPGAKATAEGVAAAHDSARKAADLYLEALRASQVEKAREYHVRYMETLDRISAAGRRAKP